MQSLSKPKTTTARSAYVIHAATPTWTDGLHGEAKLLRQAYDMCLELAVEYKCDSIAFPLLASGNHGFSKGKALQVAIAAFSEFLMEHEMQIYLVVFSRDSVKLSEKLVHNVRCYIDQNYVDTCEQENYESANEELRRIRYQRRRNLYLAAPSGPARHHARQDHRDPEQQRHHSP